FLTLWACYPDFFQYWFCITTFGKVGASKKFPITAHFVYHFMATFLAINSRGLILYFYFLNFCLCSFQALSETTVNIIYQIYPIRLAILYGIQIILHFHRKFNINDFRKKLL